jgi:hypothetical protein
MNSSPLFTMQAVDALLDKLGEIIRQRDASIRLGLIIAGGGSLQERDAAFSDLYALKSEITRQQHNPNNTTPNPIPTP